MDTSTQIPAPVRDYVAHAAPVNAIPESMGLSQRGAMRLKPSGAWKAFDATQTIRVREPGFVWRARMSVAPLVSLRIADEYANGKGCLEARLFGFVRLARSTGPETDKGELMRYLAELVWAPHAMLYNPHLSWRELAESTVEVSAPSSAGPARVRLLFEAGVIRRIEADDRPRAEGGRMIPSRWSGRFSDYRQFGSYRLPARAEVSWDLDEGPFACWRGEITGFEPLVGLSR